MTKTKQKTTNKEHDYWFKRRRYGWGWTPVRWQGWLTVLIFIAIIIFISQQAPAESDITNEQQTRFMLSAIGVILGTYVISRLTGPKPRWRWGKSPKDNPNEDY